MPGCLPRREWKTGLALRLYAEDPVLQLPQPGVVVEVSEKREWIFPGAVARLDLAVKAGDEVSPMGSPVLGGLLIGAEDRKRATTVARGLLEEIWIAGSIQTNEHFLHELLSHPWVKEGMFHASFVDEEFIPAIRCDAELLKVFARMAQLLSENQPGSANAKWAVGDQWMKEIPEAEVLWKSGPQFFQVGEPGKEMKGLTAVFQSQEGPTFRACCYPLSPDRWQARVGNWFLPIRRVVPKSSKSGTVFPKLTALVGGRVHSILFREGAWVTAHEPALLVESLGMLVPHALPADVRVVKWHVAAEDMVYPGQLLAEFERAAQIR
jgi:acetyl/propionyl-CoA carboxylase alpha subunit